MKNLHPYEKSLIAAFLILAALTIASVLTSCGSVKKVVKTDVKSHVVTNVDSVTKTDKITDTKFYDDTLKGSLNPTGIDTVQTDTVESAGLKLYFKIKPQYNKAGQISGNVINYTAIAKPIAHTDSHETQQTQVTKKIKVDTKADTNTKTTTKVGFTLPWWMWIIAILVTLGVLTYFTHIIKF